MTHNLNEAPEGDMVEVFTPFITKNGKRIFKKDGGYSTSMFRVKNIAKVNLLIMLIKGSHWLPFSCLGIIKMALREILLKSYTGVHSLFV